jgi:hypothetical protein
VFTSSENSLHCASADDTASTSSTPSVSSLGSGRSGVQVRRGAHPAYEQLSSVGESELLEEGSMHTVGVQLTDLNSCCGGSGSGKISGKTSINRMGAISIPGSTIITKLSPKRNIGNEGNAVVSVMHTDAEVSDTAKHIFQYCHKYPYLIYSLRLFFLYHSQCSRK